MCILYEMHIRDWMNNKGYLICLKLSTWLAYDSFNFPGKCVPNIIRNLSGISVQNVFSLMIDCSLQSIGRFGIEWVSMHERTSLVKLWLLSYSTNGIHTRIFVVKHQEFRLHCIKTEVTWIVSQLKNIRINVSRSKYFYIKPSLNRGYAFLSSLRPYFSDNGWTREKTVKDVMILSTSLSLMSGN